MKKIETPLRKHGYKARQASLAGKIVPNAFEDCSRPLAAIDRLRTLLTFQSQTQVYLWTTDRGRSRLIKH